MAFLEFFPAVTRTKIISSNVTRGITRRIGGWVVMTVIMIMVARRAVDMADVWFRVVHGMSLALNAQA